MSSRQPRKKNFQALEQQYPRSLIIAIIGHVILLAALLLNFTWLNIVHPGLPQTSDQPPIQAVAIDQKVLNMEIKHVQQVQAQQREAVIEKQQAIEKAAEEKREQIIQKRLAEKRQKELVAEQKAAAEKQKQLLAQQKLLAQQQAIKQAKIQAEKAAAAKKTAEAAREQKIKEAKLQQAKLEKEKLAKEEQAKLAKAKAAKLKQEKINAEKLAQQKEIQKALNDESSEQAVATSKTKEENNLRDQDLALIQNAIEANFNRPPGSDQNASCILTVKLTPDGKVVSVSIAQSSGDNALDEAAITAVYKSQPLPVPDDLDLFNRYFKEFNIKA